MAQANKPGDGRDWDRRLLPPVRPRQQSSTRCRSGVSPTPRDQVQVRAHLDLFFSFIYENDE